jgi:hypothetical protein
LMGKRGLGLARPALLPVKGNGMFRGTESSNIQTEHKVIGPDLGLHFSS